MASELLTQYYREDPKIKALIDGINSIVQDDLIIPSSEVAEQLNVLTARGEWLDWIGERVGLPRPFVSEGDVSSFGFDDNGVGFDQGPFSPSSQEGAVPLADDTYRRYIIARGGQLITNGTVPDMNNILTSAFGDGHYIDNMDMTMSVRISFGFTDDLISIVRNLGLVTKPAGVRLNILYDEDPDTGSFGFDDNGVGFDQAPFVTIFDLEA